MVYGNPLIKVELDNEIKPPFIDWWRESELEANTAEARSWGVKVRVLGRVSTEEALNAAENPEI